jgi:hypothetical protein
MPSPYRREELIAEMATLVYLLSGSNGPGSGIQCLNVSTDLGCQYKRFLGRNRVSNICRFGHLSHTRVIMMNRQTSAIHKKTPQYTFCSAETVVLVTNKQLTILAL